MYGRDLTFDGGGECAGSTWPTAAGVRRVQAPGNASEFMTHDTSDFYANLVYRRAREPDEQPA